MRAARCTVGMTKPSRRRGASPQDVKEQYANASICGNNRVVFNIGGNNYQLVVKL
jgi:mRNA-degrading endonuclease HigB of HigAB toxin-antitoxin module